MGVHHSVYSLQIMVCCSTGPELKMGVHRSVYNHLIMVCWSTGPKLKMGVHRSVYNHGNSLLIYWSRDKAKDGSPLLCV